MAGYRLAPLAARARRRPWQRRTRQVFGPAVTPATISGSSSAAATGSLTLTTTAEITFAASTATASANLSLGTTSAVDPRAAPGWLGLFITEADATAASISGGSNVTASASLNLQTPARAQISGSSNATASGSLTLRNNVETRIATPTFLGSSQFGNSTVSSAQFGNSSVVPYTDHPIS